MRKNGPTAVSPKVCTERRISLRVIKVPKMVRVKVRIISTILHALNMPFLFCIIMACRKAVTVSQGISPAFSTGSHAQ